MTGPSSPARQAAIDAATEAIQGMRAGYYWSDDEPEGALETDADPSVDLDGLPARGATVAVHPDFAHVIARKAVEAYRAALADGLFIAATSTGDDTVYRLAEPGPYVPDDPADPAAWEELDGHGPLSTRMPAEVWGVIAAVLPRAGETRSDGEAGEAESTFEQRFPDWDRSNFMVAGRYFDSELAPTYGRVPDDISAEHLEKQRQQYVASAASNLDAAAELQEWDRRRRGKA